MDIAALSLAALILALILSMGTSVNVGLVALVLAWLVGVYAGGMRVEQVLAGFPVGLFLTLVGITLLFAQAQVNGTLERLSHRAIRACRGNAGAIAPMFFVLTALLSSVGPGNIASTALMAPVGMAAAGRYGIPPFLMAIMIANGASAGSVSPFAPTGVIVNGVAAKIGLPDASWTIYLNNFAAHAAVAFCGYFLFGGWRLFARRQAPVAVDVVAAAFRRPESELQIIPPISEADDDPEVRWRHAQEEGSGPFEWRHVVTITVILALVLSVVFLQLNVGLAALAGAVVLTLVRAADERKAVAAMPWQVIMMVSGITVLVALLEKSGGMDLFTQFLARFTTPATSTAVAAFFTGVVSIYSSTTGVVLPALLPTIPGLIQHVGGGDPMALLSSMTVGGHLVDVSPLSTLGALCLAAAPAGTDTRRLFNQLLMWGASMAFVGAAVSWVLFGLL
jgi:Na+/H+ antiporter NhaD/arsenite permease-like protein